MIKFFRHIRKRLLIENNTGKYLKYAIGEIVLVVIGILIALQINNWNEEKKNKNDVFLIKENIYEEFKQNKVVLKERIALLDSSIDHAKALMGFMGSSDKEIYAQNVDSIIVYTLFYGNFNPSNSAIIELLQSGKLKLIKDKKIKNQLADWLQLLEDTNEDFENQDLLSTEYLLPYLRENGSIRNFDLQTNKKILSTKSTLIEDYLYYILNDHIFENLIYDQILSNNVMVMHYRELDSLASEIMNQLKK